MRRRSWLFAGPILLAACSRDPAAATIPDAAIPPIDPPVASTGVIPARLDPPPPPSTACAESAEISLFVSPLAPRAGAPLRVIAVSDKPLEGAIAIHGAEAAPRRSASDRHGGPPYWWFVDLPSPPAGAYRAEFTGAAAACKEIAVEPDPAPARPRTWSAVWGVHAAWTGPMEQLYSAWIEKLFDAPLDQQPAWPALHEVLRDADRNLLHDHLGQGEDDAGPHALVIDPDCADMPYFLRAYFAYKLGLPFGYSICTRGGGGQGPHCRRWHSNLEVRAQRRTEIDAFGDFLRITLADAVHSGTARVPMDDDGSDYYPVPLTFESLRPGTVYADPYGHVLIVAKRIPQTDGAAGVLLAVDGQPDGTVSRRRFWRGNFLFAQDPALGSPGFKRFRPVVLEAGRARPLTNREIAEAPGYGDLSLAPFEGGVEGFYDRMDDVLSPAPLDPGKAMIEAIQALEEQVKGRVLSVENGRKYWESGGAKIDMPEGASIFEADGPWEDFSTPSRDLRLLIAIDVVKGFPDRVARRPDRFAMPAGKPVEEVKRDLAATLDRELLARSFSYTRSDGTPFTLSLAEVTARAAALEMAYDPNDCVEVRWGAPDGSEERSTCRRRAPPGQIAEMRRHRAWFHERKRPPRE